MIHGLFYKMPLRETLFYTVTGSYERPLSLLPPFRIYGRGQSIGGQSKLASMRTEQARRSKKGAMNLGLGLV